MSRRRFLRGLGLFGLWVSSATAAIAKPLRLRSGSWFEVRSLSGTVVYQGRGDRLRAWVGQRFNGVGDTFETGPKSTAVLSLESGIGQVYIAEQTKLTITRMETNANGGIVTLLDVSQGQVRLKVRPFTNPTSKLEIKTPAGIAGVRGTEFGVVTQPNGQTGIATRSGLVAAVAQGETVELAAATQSLVVPQSPPTPAQPLRDDLGLYLDLARMEGNQVRLVGKVDPVNLLLIEHELQNIDRTGAFDRLVSEWQGNVVTVKVITPLGAERRYELPVIIN